MSTIKISQLGNIAQVTDATLLPVVDTSNAYITVKSTGAQIKNYVTSNVGNIIPHGNVISTLGNATNQWSTVYANTVSAGYLFGNGSQITGITVSYGNTQVAQYLPVYLPSYTGNISATTITANGNISANYIIANAVSGTTNVYSIGYLNVPQNYLGNVTPNYTLQLTDQSHHLLSSNNTRGNIYIPTYANVAFPIGSTVQIVNFSSAANLSIIGNIGVTLYLAGNTISGSNTRIMTAGGLGTLLNIAANVWVISGTNIS